jgi:hypothetical protein
VQQQPVIFLKKTNQNDRKSKSFAYANLQYPYQHSVEQEGPHSTTVGGYSCSKDVQYIEYIL